MRCTENSRCNQQVPKHFLYGPRKLNVVLTQIRHSAPFLNDDLYNDNIINTAACRRGAPSETTNHFFFECNNYN